MPAIAKLRRILPRIAMYSVLIVAALLIAFPYYWMVITTLKPASEVYSSTVRLFPSRLTWGVYPKLLADSNLPVVRFFVNSVVIAVGATAICVVTAVLAAYPLARRHVPGSKPAYLAIVSTMMVPGEVVMIGIFMVVNEFHLIDKYMGMILPLSVHAIVFLIVYNYMLQLPKEIDDAALVDGANMWQQLWHVLLPLSKPAVYSGTVLAFLHAWQNFSIPYILAQSNKMYPLSVGALFMESTLYATMQETLSLSTILTLPTLLIFVLTQRFVFGGITAGAVKG